MWTLDDPQSYNKSAVNITRLQAKEDVQLSNLTNQLYSSLDDIQKRADILANSINTLENNLGIIKSLINVLVGE
jgi:hypothetical protein